MSSKLYLKRVLLCSMIALLSLLAVIFVSDKYVSSYNQYSSDDYLELENHHVGLVLGTSKYTVYGTVNLFYKHRVEAAANLYHACKINKILVSGDNSTLSYNEPQTFFNDLVKLGVAPNDIYLDYAGFRTLDSVVRAKEVFKQNKLLVISQDFHNERAVFIARSKGIEANAFNATSVDFSFSPKTFLREKLARVKAMLDIYILNTEPRFLGEEITMS